MSLKSDGVRDGITGEDHNSKRQCKRRNGNVSERIVNMAWFTFSEILATTTSLVWPSVTNPLGLDSSLIFLSLIILDFSLAEKKMLYHWIL